MSKLEVANFVLEAKALSKSYREGDLSVDVLKSVNVQIAQGERCAIVGASGSGKSTLLHLLGGLDTPTSGGVSLLGKDYSSLSESKRGKMRNQHLGFVYQFHHLLPEFTVLDNVAMPLFIRRVPTEVARKHAKEILGEVGLNHRLLHKPSELSGGERQRTAIARAIITRPDCLLADEPTGNLDSATAEKVYELLLDLQRQTAMSLVIVTHDSALAQSMSRILHMRDGVFVD
ncbi:MAG: lipoprotein-releasing ABC transporter ATP-binding protein LolD [Thiotrichales bacterium]|jgi:lipoprotein-releasing system ATP-binding protein|nr:lipoprotein-releasing ABC transporter ATP-binding protein LolD [Thiotrichales bacterium]